MTKTKSTKRALLMSALALLMCVSMLAGSTFAWFTDSVTSTGNIIKSGKLDVTMEWKDATVNGAQKNYKDASEGAIFNYALWEPGYVEAKNIKISNVGTLGFKYQLNVFATGTVSILADVIDVYYAEEELVLNDRSMAELTPVGTLREVLNGMPGNVSGDLKAGEAPDVVTLALKMRESAGNEYQDKSIGSEFAVQLLATQLTAEEDAFGTDYDALAEYPNVSFPTPVIPDDAMNLKSPSKNGEPTPEIDLPKEIVDELADDGITELSLYHTNPKIDTVNKTINFDAVEIVDQDGKVIDLESLGLDEKIIVTLPAGGAFNDGEVVMIYHDGTLMATAAVTGGEIIYEAYHLCAVSVTATEELKADENGDLVIKTIGQLFNFAENVNSGTSYQGKTVLLGADFDMTDLVWFPIGKSDASFNGTFDGQNHTISNLSVDLGKASNAGFFGFTQNGVVKNLTFENASSKGRLNVGVVAGTPYTSKYENISLKGHIEVNGLAYVGAVGGKNAYANWNNITVNADETSYVKAVSVENGTAYRTYVGGVVGFNGEGSHTFKNITTNIDVIGSTCDIGGVFGIAHYSNGFENITCTGDVSCLGEAEEIGGIAGVWHNATGYTVTFTNCTFKGTVSAKDGVVTGCDIVGGAYSADGQGKLIIDGATAIGSADELAKALANGGNFILLADIDADADTTITVPENVTSTLDLNGYTIDFVTDDADKNDDGKITSADNEVAIDVRGTLNVKNGTITTKHTSENFGWNACTEVFYVAFNGTLNVENATIENLGGSDMAYAIDLVNAKNVTLNVKNSTLKSTYIPVRVFNNGSGMNNVTIEDSTLEGVSRAFWVHIYSSKDNGGKGVKDATLNLNIFGNGNTFKASKPERIIEFGFDDEINFDANGNKI